MSEEAPQGINWAKWEGLTPRQLALHCAALEAKLELLQWSTDQRFKLLHQAVIFRSGGREQP